MKAKQVTSFLILISVLVVGCNDINNVKFEKANWTFEGDLATHPFRKNMLKDLIAHHQIKGLTYHQLTDSLGPPENFKNDDDSLYYDIVTNYGYLDPKSGIYLAIGLNKDSVATGFKIVSWQNRHANE